MEKEGERRGNYGAKRGRDATRRVGEGRGNIIEEGMKRRGRARDEYRTKRKEEK